MRKALHILGILEDRDMEWLVSNGKTKYVENGSLLIREGEPIEALGIILDGRLSVRSVALGDREIAALHSGEIVGELSFVDYHPPSASVLAVQDSQVFLIPAVVLRNKLGRDDGFAARFYRAIATFLADRLRTTTGRLGFGNWGEDSAVDELSDTQMDDVSMAARRFDDLLRRLRTN